MGKRGPPPKPTPLRVLEGDRGKSRRTKVRPEPAPAPGPCDPPAHLAPESRAVWECLAPELEAKGLLAPRYLDTFEVFCDAFVQYRRAASVLARTGPVVQGRMGELVTNPASREFARYASIVRAFGSDFGLSPAATTAIARGVDSARRPGEPGPVDVVTLPVCGYVVEGRRCTKRGAHRCRPRIAHVVGFFTELLVHTKGDYARQTFVLAPWQRRRIIEPLFGEVTWDRKRKRYVRRYRTLYLFVARKNGKTELLAGICLYLLVGDCEEAGEIYGLALDRDQAGHVYRAAARMVELSPELRKRIDVLRSVGRLVDPKTASFLSVLAGDAPGTLGATPHGAYIDELLTQPDRELYDALRTAMGTRAQPLLMMATTAESDANGFAAGERAWSERVVEDPTLDPSRLVVMYAADREADWTKETTWHQANPALGDFLDVAVLRDECRKAIKLPAEERAFRQFRLNQPVSAVGRAIDLRVWDASAGLVVETELEHRRCHGGLDLATTTDLAALCWDFPQADGTHLALWRLWCPQAAIPDFDRRTGGRASVWAKEGYLEVTEGNVIDYRVIRARIGHDAEAFDVIDVGYDRWGATQLVQDLVDDGLAMVGMGQGFASMSAPTKELLRLVAAGEYHHGGNPAVRWQASNVITRTDPAGNLKVDKARSPEKVDGIVAAVMALDRATRHTGAKRTYAAASF